MQKKYPPYKKATPFFILILYLCCICLALVYYLIGTSIFQSDLKLTDYLVFTSCLGIIIVGGYQLYFWTQYNYCGKRRCYLIALDDKIPFMPWFIWIYSFVYFFLIGLVMATLPSLQTGIYYLSGGILLLTVHCIWFYFFPSVLPSHWRKFNQTCTSSTMLRFVQRFDQEGNCMPSMHMSVAAYVGLLLFPILSYFSLVLVAIIGFSCILTKQHTILDLFPGIVLGSLAFLLIT